MKQPVDQRAFGRRVRARRDELGLTQDELATTIGMSQQGLDSIEKGKVARPRLLHELAEGLATTREWLLWGEGQPKAIPARPQEQIEDLVQRLSDERKAVVIRFIKTILERNSENDSAPHKNRQSG